ncbi:MAG: hypothetical protein CVV44_13410 [Spirochaetae bacterium HGW-Spirochaetae-1]|nr:MAG: hypothetical protein CVV44_13410 [Spirochaetae bacterium HGW-Spirochaetae-1]
MKSFQHFLQRSSSVLPEKMLFLVTGNTCFFQRYKSLVLGRIESTCYILLNIDGTVEIFFSAGIGTEEAEDGKKEWYYV